MAEQDTSNQEPIHTAPGVQLNVHLPMAPASIQPVYANFVATQVSQDSLVFDFAFIEPNAINKAIKKSGINGSGSETLNGQAVSRVVLGRDTVAELALQHNNILNAPPKIQ